MINRALIRLKLIQIVYAYYQNEDKSVNATQKEFLFSLSKAYDLYNFLLLLMVAITEYAHERIEKAKSKHAPTKEELNPNMKFIQNRFIQQIAVNKQLNEYCENQKRTWNEDLNTVKAIAEQILTSDTYAKYMTAQESSYELDHDLWKKLYKQFIYQNPILDDALEDMSLYWNDDKEIVDTFVMKTIKRFSEKSGPEQELLPEYNDFDDRTFAIELLDNSLKNEEYFRGLIGEFTKNWELDRIALMDIVLMQTALAEITTFKNIPINVTFNEYLDLSKLYSTNKSPSFINGTLDSIVKHLKKEGKLLKN